VDVGCGALPDLVEYSCAAGEMNACQFWGIQHQVADLGACSGNEIDYAIGQSGFLKYLHNVIAAIDGGSGRFPDHGIAHQSGGGGQIAGNGGEIERVMAKTKPSRGRIR
jgi:hypothetical protein